MALPSASRMDLADMVRLVMWLLRVDVQGGFAIEEDEVVSKRHSCRDECGMRRIRFNGEIAKRCTVSSRS